MPTQQLIALDSGLVADLQSTLEACRLELERVRQQARGNEPYTLKQAAAYLHVSYTTLKNYIDRRELTPSEYGSRVWLVRSELDNFLFRHRRK